MKFDNIDKYINSLNIAFKSLNESFYDVGEMLFDINQDKLYKPIYKSFVAFCKSEFQLSKTKAYTFIKIYKLLRDRPEFKECNYSQLQEISAVKEEELNNFSADMTVQEIRDMKKAIKGEPTSKKQSKKELEDEKEKLIKENMMLKEKLNEVNKENSLLKNKLASIEKAS